ncbi:hypothetical protein ckin130_07320 [Helicobacter pylori]
MGVKGVLKHKISPYPLKSFAIKPSNQNPIFKKQTKNINLSILGSQWVVG